MTPHKGVGPYEPLPYPWWNVDESSLVQVATVAMGSWQKPCPGDSVSQHAAPFLALVLGPFSTMFPEPKRGWHRCPIQGWALNSHLLSALWPFMYLCINKVHFRQKFSWPRQRAALIFGHKDKYLEASLILCSFVNAAVIGPPLQGLWTPQPSTFDQSYSECLLWNRPEIQTNWLVIPQQ